MIFDSYVYWIDGEKWRRNDDGWYAEAIQEAEFL